MNTKPRFLILTTAAVALAIALASAQDAPALGDLARQQRQQKDQSKAATEKTLKPIKVITNEEIPEHPESPVARSNRDRQIAPAQDPTGGSKIPAAQWKSQILVVKNQINSLEGQVDQLNESIRFAPANCAANCVGWNERQREKQQQVERMQAQLQDQKRRLDDMQDSARKQGYGSAVYDP